MNETVNDSDPSTDTDGSVTPVVEISSAPVVPEDDTPAPVKRKSVGRRVDTEGKTALGMARIIFAANPNATSKQLKTLFIEQLTAWNVTPQVAATYASLVRKGASDTTTP